MFLALLPYPASFLSQNNFQLNGVVVLNDLTVFVYSKKEKTSVECGLSMKIDGLGFYVL